MDSQFSFYFSHLTPSSSKSAFTCPEIVFHILSFSSVSDLLNKYQKLNTTAHSLVAQDGYLLASCLRNALGMREGAALQLQQEESLEEAVNLLQHPQIVSLLHLAKFCVKHAKMPPPMQMFAFRSSIGSDDFWGDLYQIYNMGTGYYESGFCSRESGPGCFTMIPFPYNNVKFQKGMEDFQVIEDFAYSWKESMGAIRDLEQFVLRDLRNKNKGAQKEKVLRRFDQCQNMGKIKKRNHSWKAFEQWVRETLLYAREVRKIVNRPKKKVAQRRSMEEGIPLDLTVVEYDASQEFRVMKDYLFTLFEFCISTTPSYTCSIKCFAVLLHDEPIVVQHTPIYEIVKSWTSRERVRENIKILGNELPEAYKENATPVSYCTFFKQIYYLKHESEKVRLLCWGQCRNPTGDFFFYLPSAVSTRFITLVGINSYNTAQRGMQGNHTNLDVHKFMPFGFIVPCL